MLLRLFVKTIGELPPGQRLNVLQPVLAVLFLALAVYFLFNVISNDNKEKVQDLKIEKAEDRAECKERQRQDSVKIDKLESKIDILSVKYYELSLRGYTKKLETVSKLKTSVKAQKHILK